ncbi:aminoacyl-histidine dipeptidase [Chitinilyticum piscinae]|uniref:Cytosol non-specific dipeptidase n=1 Tax=Chitinilyticum piscinae TaxID=2866724 RepID=A0A8J7FIU3_9NEIS|nr:aminoacyl-histidine dipeptidase [Chitinilyticum piscinae]MBE9610105.1 aminoacyl-histidine dipeptidase [Chitinilyticum piscinae]
MSQSPLDLLQPARLWQHFATLCDIPRPSRHEAVLRRHIADWARGRGFGVEQDDCGNLLIRKPATPGMEDRAGVVLQGHLDMVAQKNEATAHNFHTDPIRPRIDGGWVYATGTTLGADNGIGVAAALAVLEDDGIAHGPLEVLLTVDEEAGMTGARALQPGWLQGELLFNLDTEDWGEFYLGCAGGVDAVLARNLISQPMPSGYQAAEFVVQGLRGGHSGVDIHLERGNAIQLLARVLQAADERFGGRLVELRGGTLRNALPREAFAMLAVPACDLPLLAALADEFTRVFRAELAGTDDKVEVLVRPAAAGIALSATDSRLVLNLLQSLPHGIRRWSKAVPGVVETSNNLGVVKVEAKKLHIDLMVRSLTDSGMQELTGSIAAVARLAGCSCELQGAYPGWAPKPASRALALLQDVYRSHYGKDAAVKVIHAGLECGLIGAAYPGLEMVSFGPTIRGAHSPDEGVEISTVASFWELLCAALAAVPLARVGATTAEMADA